MFIDRLLSDWDIDKINQLLVQHGAIPTGLDPSFLFNELIKSVPFNIQNIADYYSQKRNDININSFPNVKPAFPNTWYEFKPGNLYQDMSYPDASFTTIGVLTIENYDDRINEYVASSFGFVERKNLPIGYTKMIMNTRYSIDGKIINSWFTPETSDETGVGLANTVMTTWLATSFLHCKNVTIQCTEPPAKLQKARERRGKLPLFTFKTLEIKPIVKVLKEEGQSETQGLARALHICRGHFKDFQEGPGLGKNHAHGLYWWDSQVRGNREVGAVIKDYKVSPQ
jgi:hypothetical protein